jgi:hypothetical protein
METFMNAMDDEKRQRMKNEDDSDDDENNPDKFVHYLRNKINSQSKGIFFKGIFLIFFFS